MQTTRSSSFDPYAWCAQLAGTIDHLLLSDSDPVDAVLARAQAVETVRDYDAAIRQAMQQGERLDNVIPIRRFSLDAAIDEVLPAVSVLERADWPVHQPAAPEAPIPGVHWYGGCEPDFPGVDPETGRCEGCGEQACVVCGREDCPEHPA